MERVERTFYPDGTIREEIHYKGTKEHGAWRKWQPNGVLAGEYWFEDGIYNTCVNRTWHPNGQLHTETTHVHGTSLGRGITFRANGKVLSCQYFLETGPVTKYTYDQACLLRPELPRYGDLSSMPGSPPSEHASIHTQEGTALRCPIPSSRAIDAVRNSDRFTMEIFGGEHAEAMAWLQQANATSKRTLGDMSWTESLAFVTRLYDLGSESVWAVQIEPAVGSDEHTSRHLIAALPTEAGIRTKLFEFEKHFAEEYGFDAAVDHGQNYLYFMLA